MTKKLYYSYKRTTETASLRSLDGPQGLLWKTSAQELPDFFRAIFRRSEQNAAVSRTPGEPISYIINR